MVWLKYSLTLLLWILRKSENEFEKMEVQNKPIVNDWRPNQREMVLSEK